MTKPRTFMVREPDTGDTSDAHWILRHPDTMKQQERLRKKLEDRKKAKSGQVEAEGVTQPPYRP